MVVTSRDVLIPADVNGIRIALTSSSTGGFAEREEGIFSWPQTLTVRPTGNSAFGTVQIVVEGQLASASGTRVVIRRVVNAAYSIGTTRTVEVELDRACLGVTCGIGADCQQGVCSDATMIIPDSGMRPDVPLLTDARIDVRDVSSSEDSGEHEEDVLDPLPDGGVPMDAPLDARADAPAAVDAPSDVTVDVPRDVARDRCVIETCNGLDDDCDTFVDEALPCRGNLLISEVATGGPTTALDEFVEIYNPTAHDIVIMSVKVEYLSSASGESAWEERARVASLATIPAHGFYLFTSMSYVQGTPPDTGRAWSSGFAHAGGHVRILWNDVELDRLGWGSAIACEGGSCPVPRSDTSTWSYERKAVASSTADTMTFFGTDASRGNGYDTDVNSEDFVTRAARNPQGSRSAPETP